MAARHIVLLLLAVCSYQAASYQYKTDTLKLVLGVFRHGDRTNDPVCTWPKDPHWNESFDPYGWGELTNEGKQRVYGLGKTMYERYNNFLGGSFKPSSLYAVSTEYNRTKATLQVVLAGLFPPKDTAMEWERELNWQPISYNCMAKDSPLMSFPLYYCPNYIKLYEKYMQTPEGRKFQQKYFKLFPYVSFYTGLNVTKTTDLLLVYFGLRSHREWGFTLPPWAYEIYSDLEAAAAEHYVHASATPELKKLTGGFLIKEMLTNIQLKLSNAAVFKDRKIYLYSAHEYNVAFALRFLGVFKPHVPQYGSCVILEVHTINGVDGIVVYYEDYTGLEPWVVRIPGCDYFCPLEQFIKLVKNILPENNEICGKDLPRLAPYRAMRYH